MKNTRRNTCTGGPCTLCNACSPVHCTGYLGLGLLINFDKTKTDLYICMLCYYHLFFFLHLHDFVMHLSHMLNPDVRCRPTLEKRLLQLPISYLPVYQLPATTLAPLRRVMNAAIRFVAGLRPRGYVSSARRDLLWLPIEQRIVYKLCII